MSQCIDKNSQTTNNALALPAAPYTNSRGEYTLAQIDKFAEEFTNNILQDTEKNPVNIAVNRYGDSFYESYNPLNGFVRSNDLGLYPDLEKRILIGNITALEYADFIKQYNHSPNSAANKRNSNPSTFLFELNSYYKASFSTSAIGGFCKLMPQIFGAIEAFFNLLEDIGEAIDDAIKFLNKIRNYKQELSNLSKKKIVEKLIEEITEKILEFVDDIFLALEEAVFNFDVTQFEEDPPPPAGQRIAKRAARLKAEATSFFTKDTKERIKAKFRKMINYAVGLFENPSLDEIQYLIARFCALATGVEALIKDVKSPINNFESKYTTVVNRIRNMSNDTTADAVRNGAVRVAPDVKRESINTMEQQWNYNSDVEQSTANLDPSVIRAIVDSYTPTGEVRNNIIPPSAREYGDLPSFQKIRDGQDSRFAFSGDWVKVLGAQGWNRLDEDLVVALMRLQEQLGFKITITSAWRSIQYNASLADSARESTHTQGLAVDIARPEIYSRFGDLRFIQIAGQAGFKFVQVYPPPGGAVSLGSIPTTPGTRSTNGLPMVRVQYGVADSGFYHLDVRTR